MGVMPKSERTEAGLTMRDLLGHFSAVFAGRAATDGEIRAGAK